MSGDHGRGRGRGRERGRPREQGIVFRDPVIEEGETSDEENNNEQGQTSNESTTPATSRELPIDIEPGLLWFDDSQVVRRVSRSFKNNYDVPYLSWKEAPKSKRDAWFANFRTLCNWDPKHEDECRKQYNETCRKRLKDAMYDAGQMIRGKNPVGPGWMLPNVFKELIEKRKNKAFIKRSKQASINKKGGEDGPTTHHYGSIKAVKHAAKMAQDKGGVAPNAVELFLDSHMRMVDGEEQWSHPTARARYQNFQRMIAELTEQGLPIDVNKVWYDSVDGYKKGQVFGLGTAASLYYTPPASSSSTGKSSASQQYIPGVLTQSIQAREREVEEFRKYREDMQQRDELYVKNQEELRQQITASQAATMREREETRRQIEALAKLLESQTQYRCNNNIFDLPTNPNNDNPGGGGSGFQV